MDLGNSLDIRLNRWRQQNAGRYRVAGNVRAGCLPRNPRVMPRIAVLVVT